MTKLNINEKMTINGGYLWNTIYLSTILTGVGVGLVSNILNIINSTKHMKTQEVNKEISYIYSTKSKTSTNFF